MGLRWSHLTIAAVLTGSCDTGDEYAIFTDAFNRLLHRVVIPHTKGMVWERVKFF